ncbi:hypothetical protein TcCL_NonESM06508 [Trypanosoma cruzi]|nr:hypothetical protein TcCL_NonESM06508 [Trypanosoma cruzi]
MSSGVQSICNMDRSILAYCRRVDGATQTIATKKAAQLSSFIVRSCVQQKVVNCPLGTFSAATLTAHTVLKPPRSLPSCSLSKAGMSEVRRATVISLRISSIALLVG